MNYLLAVIAPPLSMIFAGRFVSFVFFATLWFGAAVTLIVIPPLLLAVHVLFVIIAWIMISQARADRRHRRTVAAMSR